MVDIKLGEQVYEGVTAVKLNTADGGTVTFEEPDDLTPIAEAMEALGVTVESSDVEGLAATVAACLDPWELLPFSGTDKLGDYAEVSSTKTPNVNSNSGYVRLKKEYCKNVLCYPDNLFGASYDLTNFASNTFGVYPCRKGPGVVKSLINSACASRVILPEEYPYYAYVTSNGSVTMGTYSLCSQAPVSLYLSKTAAVNPRGTKLCPGPNWITNVASGVAEQFVKCPKDTDVPYYLNMMTALTVDSMVGLFENLIDNSNGETTLTLTLGTDNLAKLTDDQKNIALAKGWNLA